MSTPYEGLQNFVAGLPDLLQPVLVALLGAIPYVEGEGSASIGIIVGINPVVAAIAGATGNILSVLGVVALTARARRAVVTRRTSARAGREPAQPGTDTTAVLDADDTAEPATGRRAKGQKRLSRWLVRFGVPGASILAPLALPTQLTAAFFVASGVKKRWVMLWQIVAIVLWTGLVAAAATGLVNLLGWV
jgi:hypothetical protein